MQAGARAARSRERPERRKHLAATNARAKKLLILTEGVVSYLSVEEVASLADDLRALDRIDGWIVEYLSSELMKYRGRGRVRWNMQNAPFKFTPPDWFAFFASHGWQCKRIGYLVEEAEHLGRPIKPPARRPRRNNEAPRPLHFQSAPRILPQIPSLRPPRARHADEFLFVAPASGRPFAVALVAPRVLLP